jgi:hypothetical protein
MGRGRAKAKQTKVARELKYSSPDTDYDALQRELAGNTNGPSATDDFDTERDESEARDVDGYDGDDRWAPSR